MSGVFSIQNLQITGNEKAVLIFIVFLLVLKNPLLSSVVGLLIYLYLKRKKKVERFQSSVSSVRFVEADAPFIFMDPQLAKFLVYVTKKFKINLSGRKNKNTFTDLISNVNELCYMLYKKNRLKIQPDIADLEKYREVSRMAYNNFHNLVYILPMNITLDQFNLIQQRFHNIILEQKYVSQKNKRYLQSPKPFNYE